MGRRRMSSRFSTRATWLAAGGSALALLVVAAVIVALGEAGHGRVPPGAGRSGGVATGIVVVVDHTWYCRSHVDLALVRIVMHDTKARDAVHLDRGCTGTIRRLEIRGNGAGLGPAGDAVKVHDGAHDLRILGGVLECGAKSHGKHQDAIQAMGGDSIVFEGIKSRYCSNSFMFINSGSHRRGIPTGVQCRNCVASTRNYSIFVGRSLESGASGGRFSSRVRPRATGLAVRPILSDNGWTPRT